MLFNDTEDIDSLRMGTFNFVSEKFIVVVIIIVQVFILVETKRR
jgi:hypothetical protein